MSKLLQIIVVFFLMMVVYLVGYDRGSAFRLDLYTQAVEETLQDICENEKEQKRKKEYRDWFNAF